jgi:hypothetical protein
VHKEYPKSIYIKNFSEGMEKEYAEVHRRGAGKHIIRSLERHSAVKLIFAQ